MKKSKKHTKIILALAVLALAAPLISWGGPKSGDIGHAAAAQPTGQLSAAAPGAPAETAHVHDWEPVRELVHRDALVEEIWVLDKEAWSESSQVWLELYECECGYQASPSALKEHQEEIESKYANGEITGIEHMRHNSSKDVSHMEERVVVHEAEGHWESQVVAEERDEWAVTGYKCACGAVK